MFAKSYVLLLVTVIIYAGNLLVGKAISDVSPITVTFCRLLIAFVVLLPLGLRQIRETHAVYKKEWKPLVGMSITGIILFNFFVYLALNYTSSTNAGIVEATTPIFTVLLGFFFLKERLHRFQLLGMLLSLFGAIWVISKGSWEMIQTLQMNIGDIFMLIAVLLWSIYTIIVKQHNSKFPVYGSLLIMMGLGVLVLFPFALLEWINGVNPPLTIKSFIGLLYLGIFPSIIALMFWNRAVQDIGASTASIFLNLLPVFTTVGAVLFLGEKIIVSQLVGGAIVIIGVLLTTKKKKKSLKKVDEQNIEAEV